MRDPELIDNQGQVIDTAQRIPDAWRVKYLQRPMDRLPADVTKAFDRLWQVEREKDRIAAQLDRTKKDLQSANTKIWIMSLIVSPLVGEGVKMLLHWALTW